jgi:hypothetical protein
VADRRELLFEVGRPLVRAVAPSSSTAAPVAAVVKPPTTKESIMSVPQVFIVGADKGGVGKTTVARLILDYLTAKSIDFRPFDTENENPKGVLKRFYPSKTEIVDLLDSDGQMTVFDNMGDAVTVIDIRAGILMKTLQTLKDIGYLDPTKCRITVFHVLGSSQASIGEIMAVTSAIPTCRYIAVANRINDTKFEFPPGSLEIGKLTERASESVDALDVTFGAYIQSGPSGVLRGYVSHWRDQVFAELDAAKLLPAA